MLCRCLRGGCSGNPPRVIPSHAKFCRERHVTPLCRRQTVAFVTNYGRTGHLRNDYRVADEAAWHTQNGVL